MQINFLAAQDDYYFFSKKTTSLEQMMKSQINDIAPNHIKSINETYANQSISTEKRYEKYIFGYFCQDKDSLQEPEYISLALESISGFIKNPSSLSSIIAHLDTVNTPAAKKIATIFTTYQDYFNNYEKLNKLQENYVHFAEALFSNKSFASILENKKNTMEHDGLNPFIDHYVKITNLPLPFSIAETEKNRLKDISSSKFWTAFNKAPIITDQEKWDEEGKKRANEFYDEYVKERPKIANLYRAMKEELNTKLQQKKGKTKLTKEGMMHLLELNKKTYPSLNGQQNLPNNFSPLEPLEENKEKVTPVIQKEEESGSAAPIKKSKGKKKNNGKKTGKKQQQFLTAPAVEPETEPIKIEQPKDPKKKIVQTNIQCIHDSMHNVDLYAYLSVKQKNKIPDFAYHARNFAWFKDAKQALQNQGYNDPNNPKYKFQDTAAVYHGFSIDIDKFAREYGSCQVKKDKDGKDVFFIALPGHIEKNGQKTFVIYGYVIDPEKKLCYHRCIEERSPEQLLNEYLNNEAWHVTLEELINE
jgi:hypothetical protein